MRKWSTWFSNSNKATLAGYATALYNAVMVIDIDHLDFKLPSTYLKLFGALVLPIIGGHMTQLKNDKNEN